MASLLQTINLTMICIDCISPTSLKSLVSPQESSLVCRYCGNHSLGIDSSTLFDHILERVVENTASDEDLSSLELGLIWDCGSDHISLADIEIVLSDWIDLGTEPYFDDLCAHIPQALRINDQGEERYYYGDDGSLKKNFYEDKWLGFTTNIQHSYRFFNTSARGFLDTVFSMLFTEDDALKPECVRVIPGGTPLYRARTASDFATAERIAKSPANELGPTPKARAGSQRMTPHGISALYCALDRETCLSEIRCITGDRVVSIAMSPIEDLKFLDLTQLSKVQPPELTLLEQGFREALHLKSFIGSLVRKMSRPRGRNDDLTYLSTQVVFEYLRLRLADQVDGLIFPSVQTGGKGINAVVFPEHSVVSERNYHCHIDDSYGLRAGADPQSNTKEPEPFEQGAKLYCLPGSLRFHQVTGVKTEATESDDIYESFMTESDRQRLGFRTAP